MLVPSELRTTVRRILPLPNGLAFKATVKQFSKAGSLVLKRQGHISGNTGKRPWDQPGISNHLRNGIILLSYSLYATHKWHFNTQFYHSG